jgi:Tol biopolymer transport system component
LQEELAAEPIESPAEQNASPGRFTRFDLVAAAVVVLLTIAIGFTVALGDRAGVGVTTTLPQSLAHTTSKVQITFTEAMDTITVEQRFAIEPTVPGKFSWNGTQNTQLTFTPSSTLTGGQSYHVTIKAGALSVQGRRLVQDVQFMFSVGKPQVVYLAPAITDAPTPSNLWIADPAAPFTGKQATFSSKGILADYAVSPDGTRIAFAQSGSDGTADLYLLTVAGGDIQRITQCVAAICQAPAWSPDGSRLVYERLELNVNLAEKDRGVARAWIVNLSDLSTAPLLASSQLLGHEPRWSPDGTHIAVHDADMHAIAVYDLTTGAQKAIPSLVGETGAFDPTGTRLVYPDLFQTPAGFFNALSVADLVNNSTKPLTNTDTTPVNDRQAAWSPDGKTLAVTRQYLDERGSQGAQVYLVNPDTGDTQTLINDPNYNHGAIAWNPAGDELVMQRYPVFDPDPKPSIWVYDLPTKTIRQIALNGFVPQWIP